MKRYPELVIDLKKLENNIKQIKDLCSKQNIKLAGVIKGCTALPEIAKEFLQSPMCPDPLDSGVLH